MRRGFSLERRLCVLCELLFNPLLICREWTDGSRTPSGGRRVLCELLFNPPMFCPERTDESRTSTGGRRVRGEVLPWTGFSALSASSCSTLFCFALSEPMKAGHQPEVAEIAERFSLGMASLSSLRAPVQRPFVLPGGQASFHSAAPALSEAVEFHCFAFFIFPFSFAA